MFKSDKYCVVVLIFLVSAVVFLCPVRKRSLYCIEKSAQWLCNQCCKIGYASPPGTLRGYLSQRRTDRCEGIILLSPSKISDFYATYQIGRGGKTLSGQCFVRFVKYSVLFKEESPCEDRVQKANHIAESADKRKDSRVCTFKKRKKNGKRFLSYRIFPELYPRTG